MLTGVQVKQIRTGKNFSQQELAYRSGVNKAYISEYESGIRPALPAEMMTRLEHALLESAAGGRTQASIVRKRGRPRLVLRDADGNEYVPASASVQWTESDGSTYSMWLGEVDQA